MENKEVWKQIHQIKINNINLEIEIDNLKERIKQNKIMIIHNENTIKHLKKTMEGK